MEFEDDYSKLEAKIVVLENKLDEALLAKFELEQKQKIDGLLRFEMQELLRNIYHACHNLTETESNRHEKKPNLEIVLNNLSQNIRIFAKDYNINL